ncbi:carbonic anhydrase [Lentibacillus saliphilus]|uniref:carbonic anhydrase n=1 Tax=Lentibacillus saliphilus TaxID=2737028 RepID=UPI001C2FB911|nr:carbonic anhydrase [Lentibacillus saliphilus]
MNEAQLKHKNEEFIHKIKRENPNFFDGLKEGQSPEFFMLACSDSRVSPSVITQMPLGEMFVHRNIANQVDQEDESFSASLYYALVHLNIKKIIIKGHTDCGGVKAAWSDGVDEALSGWIGKVKQSLPDKTNANDVHIDELTKMNVQKQVARIKDHPVFKAYGEGVQVTGYLYHVATGELEKL